MTGRLFVCVLWLTACGAKPEAEKPPEKPAPTTGVAAVDKAAAKANELAAGVNKPALTAEQYEALILGLESCELKGFSIDEKCPGLVALREGMKNSSTAWKDLGGMNAGLGKKHIGHKSPAIRVKSAELMGGMLGTTESSQDVLLEAADKETNPQVLQAFIRTVANSGGKNTKVAALLLKSADHADKDVRLQAVYAISSSWNREMAGGAEKLASMVSKDADPAVQRAACQYAGGLGNKLMMPVYAKNTGAKVDKDMNSACMSGLVSMFHAFPLFETANQDAYKLFLKRLNEKPRTENAPPWIVMSSFRYAGDPNNKKLAEWKEKAKWFKPADVKKALAGVVADKKSNWMSRTGAIDSLLGLGATKKEFEALKKGYDSKDSTDALVLKKIDEALEKAAT